MSIPNGKKYHRQDGGVTITPRTRYVCYNKTRHAALCDGQTGYSAPRLDSVVDTVVRNLFAQLDNLPKDTLIAERNAAQALEIQLELIAARANLQAHTTELLEYEAEVLKVIRGESRLNSDLLNKLYEQAKVDCATAVQAVHRCEQALQTNEERREGLSQQFDTMQSWATLYSECDMATKKMSEGFAFRFERKQLQCAEHISCLEQFVVGGDYFAKFNIVQHSAKYVYKNAVEFVLPVVVIYNNAVIVLEKRLMLPQECEQAFGKPYQKIKLML